MTEVKVAGLEWFDGSSDSVRALKRAADVGLDDGEFDSDSLLDDVDCE